MNNRRWKGLQSTVSIMLIAVLMFYQAMPTMAAPGLGLGSMAHLGKVSGEAVFKMPAATPSMPELATASDSTEEEEVLQEADLLSWDAYVMENPERITASPSDAQSEPQHVDLSAGSTTTVPETTADYRAMTAKRYSVLVLDVSGSMWGSPLEYTKLAAMKFCEQVLDEGGNNYVAVVAFGSTANPIHDFTTDLNSLNAAIEGITSKGSTNHHAALSFADMLLKEITEPNAIKNILLLSDGLPESGSISLDGPYTILDYPFGYYYANAAYEKAEELKEKYYIYTLGFFHSLSGLKLDFGRRYMSDIQNAGYYEVLDPEDLEFEFGDIANDILKKSGNFRYAGALVPTRDAEAVYYYNDAYFFTDASVYNPMLATMSLCLELSSWPSYNTESWPDKSRNARELLTGAEGLGFQDFDQNQAWSQLPNQDSIGVVAANKKITDFKDSQKPYTLIALAIRGGGYGSEWASNFTMGESGAHEGFTGASRNVLEFLNQYIEKYGITGDIKLWVVGYSRGAAVANLTGGSLNGGYSLSGVNLDKEDLYVYTFGTPQGTVTDFAGGGDDSNIYNVINWNDPVPLVAPDLWDFTRYNKAGDLYLPAAITHNNFSDLLLPMLKQFHSLNGAAEEGYQVREFSTVEDIRINWNAIQPGGAPFIWNEASEVSQNRVLRETIGFLCTDVLTSRSNYAHKLQDGVRELMDVMFNENRQGDEFFEELFSKGNLITILAPIFMVSPGYNFEERLARTRENAKNSVRTLADEFGIDATDEFLDTLDEIMGGIVEQLAREIRNNNTDNLNLFLKMHDLTKSGSVAQAHYPEVCLAWMMSQDPNYNPGADLQKVPAASRIVRINCPVDVSVYNRDGNLVASIVDNKTQDVGSSILCTVNNKGEKLLYLPAEGSYRIGMEATADAEVTYSINEWDLAYDRIVRVVNYYGVPVEDGGMLTGIVPPFSDEDAENGVTYGSFVSYQLLDSTQTEIMGSEEIRGADIANSYYEVTLAAENESGRVNGTGTFLKGNFARAEAQPLSGSSLIGWYVGDTLVSTEEIYRFPVTENVRLTARFVPVQPHDLKLQAEKGGKIVSVEGYYTIGTKIAVVAEADDGYVFTHWSSADNAGSFEDAKSAYTNFIMPEQEVMLTAHFKPNQHGLHTVTVKARDGGSVSGGGTYLAGSEVILTATPDVGFIFEGWYEEGNKISSVDAVYSFTVAADRTIEARFTAKPPEKDPSAGRGRRGQPAPATIPETPGMWKLSEGNWYFIQENGILYRHTWIYTKGEWYWLDEAGIMRTGWIEVKGIWYYLNPDGKMLENTRTPDGYLVDRNGAWVR